ncbi:MAG: tryptophanase [Bacteroidales bacterium]|nr:tryptophanase [Bacteroidales bacterium]
MELPFAEPYKIKMIETIRMSTREERQAWIEQAGFNLFNLKSDQVFIDLLTDSGTGAMSDRQWAEIMTGDESYAGSASYYKLKSAIKEIFGFDHFLPTHQGRAAENVLFSVLVKEGDVVPGNSHFDTTKGHIEFRKAHAIDCTIDEAFDTEIDHPFKGNVDLGKLEKVFKTYPKEKISFVIVTLTCNSSGGQPVSLENLKQVSAMAKKYGALLLYDSARFAENAYFIKKREAGQQNRSIREIVADMYALADGMTMSSKKDGIVNIGGFIALKDEELLQKASVFNIMFEGFITYGGMAGRDMAALAQGLNEVCEYDYLNARIGQVAYLGQLLTSYGIPVQKPYGGHAIFIDANRVLSHLPKEHFRAQTLAVELYIEGGVRGVEIGAIMADRDPDTRENRYPALELVRLAIPRRVYTNNHMEYVAAAMANVFNRRASITSGMEIEREAPILRHFTVQMKRSVPVALMAQ